MSCHFSFSVEFFIAFTCFLFIFFLFTSKIFFLLNFFINCHFSFSVECLCRHGKGPAVVIAGTVRPVTVSSAGRPAAFCTGTLWPAVFSSAGRPAAYVTGTGIGVCRTKSRRRKACSDNFLVAKDVQESLPRHQLPWFFRRISFTLRCHWRRHSGNLLFHLPPLPLETSQWRLPVPCLLCHWTRHSGDFLSHLSPLPLETSQWRLLVESQKDALPSLGASCFFESVHHSAFRRWLWLGVDSKPSSLASLCQLRSSWMC